MPTKITGVDIGRILDEHSIDYTVVEIIPNPKHIQAVHDFCRRLEDIYERSRLTSCRLRSIY